jgi:hypothetical protein
MTATLLSVLAVGAALAAILWAWLDYRAWTSLGPGGLPHTLVGWLRMTWLRLQKGECIGTGPLDGAVGSEDDRAYLGALVRRAGPRPRVAPHPIPQRQTSQHAPTGIRAGLDRLFEDAVRRHEDLVGFQLSHFEKHTPAVTLCDPRCGHVFALASHGEIGHVHPSDGSMHLILSPSDAKRAIDAGWGERHGLAGRKLGLPITYTFVYSPRDDTELKAVGELLEAAIRFMGARPPTVAR